MKKKLTKDQFLIWLKAQPEGKEWNVNSQRHCPIACYLREQGVKNCFVQLAYIYSPYGLGDLLVITALPKWAWKITHMGGRAPLTYVTREQVLEKLK